MKTADENQELPLDAEGEPGAAPTEASSATDSKYSKDAPAPKGEVARLQHELEEAKAQVELLRRHAAEMDNARKRSLRDRERDILDKQISILKGMLPIVDNFERAVASLNKATDPEAVKAGTQAIFQLFTDYLAKMGVTPIAALGQKYDPNFHEAVMQISSPDVEAGHISSELEKGYLQGDRVLRHSKVVVSTGAQVSEAAEKGDGATEPD